MQTSNPQADVNQRAFQDVDDAIWSSLQDASRRRILDLLRSRSMTTGQICEHFETTRFAIMKHIKVLQGAGLVITEKKGRERINHLNPAPIQAIYRRWIRPFERVSADRLLRLKAVAENNQQE